MHTCTCTYIYIRIIESCCLCNVDLRNANNSHIDVRQILDTLRLWALTKFHFPFYTLNSDTFAGIIEVKQDLVKNHSTDEITDNLQQIFFQVCHNIFPFNKTKLHVHNVTCSVGSRPYSLLSISYRFLTLRSVSSWSMMLLVLDLMKDSWFWLWPETVLRRCSRPALKIFRCPNTVMYFSSL